MKFLQLVLILMCVSGCNNKEDRPEVVSKLRAIGVASSPVVATPNSSVTLTVYLSGPHKLVLSLEKFADPKAKYSRPIEATIDSTIKEEAVGPLSIYSFNMLVKVPPTSELPLDPIKKFNRLRYGVKVSTGDAVMSQTIVGDLLEYPNDAPQAAWQAPTITLNQPTSGATLGAESETDISATPVDVNQEKLRVGWYVSSGEISSRRAKNTQWAPGEKGIQAIIVTTRGVQSGGFAFSATEVKVE